MAMLKRTLRHQGSLNLFSFLAHHASSVQYASVGYYVLLPETPPDSLDDSAVMQYRDTPRFSLIRPVYCITGCAKLAIQNESQLNRHLESLQEIGTNLTFSRVFETIEQLSVPLDTAWMTAKHLNNVSGTDFTRAFIRIHPQVEKAKNERWKSESLHQACKQLSANRHDNLHEFQHRLLSQYLLKGHLNGQDVVKEEEKRRFSDTQKVLALQCTNFRRRVMLCQSMFSHNMDDFSALVEMPRSILSDMAMDRHNPSRGPWQVTLQPSVYIPFMEHCCDRLLRWNAWNAYNNRASVNFNDRDLANHKLIEELRENRRDLAKMLGYDNFAEMSMLTKMAGSVEKVMDMVETLQKAFWPQAQEDMADLQQFAESEGFRDQLQVWDVAYWRRRQREHLFSVDHSLVAQYLPLDSTLKGLFNLCRTLFGVTITECTGQAETWHEDVRYFELRDKHDRLLGSFFFDPFSRPAEKLPGSWMVLGRGRSDVMGTLPVSYLVMNLEKPEPSSSPVLMQFSEVLSLFHEFGHGLQQLMCQAPYSELAGQSGVELDAAQMCANFMHRWPLEPSFLRHLSSHHESGDKLPDQLINQLLKSYRHFSAYDMMRQLYLSAFDMDIYLSRAHWHDVMTRTWQEYMPLPLSRDDNHPCSFTHVFSSQYPAAYYSYKWSEMIAADAFAAFQEQGLSNSKKAEVIGTRFADTFLTLAGGVPAIEVFRRFRGRDPSLHALVEDVGAAEYVTEQC